MSLKPSEILRAATDQIRTHGWCQEYYWDCVFGSKRCAIGAVMLVVHGHPYAARHPGDRVLGFLLHATGAENIAAWNDAPGRTVDEVIEALDYAAVLAEEAGE